MPQDAPPNGGARGQARQGSWSRVAGMQAKLHRWAAADPVPLEYSIGQLTCTIASRLAAVMVGWPVGFQKSAYSCDLGRRARHGRGA
jgi:hypothetical protein